MVDVAVVVVFPVWCLVMAGIAAIVADEWTDCGKTLMMRDWDDA